MPRFSAPARVTLALAAAACWVLALPAAGIWPLAPLAPALLVLACGAGEAGVLGGAALGFLYGFVAAFGIFGWMFEIAGFGLLHAAVLGTYLGLYPALFGAALAPLSRSRLPLAWGAAAAWTAVDLLRGHAGFLAFPWGTLGISQAPDLPLLQTAAVFGEEGVTFLVVLLGAGLASAVLARRIRPLLVPASVVAFALAAGAVRLALPAPPATLRVAAVQPAILREERATRDGERATLRRLETLTREAAATHPALIVWPETAVRRAAGDEGSFAWVQDLSDGTGVTLIVGAAQSEKFPSNDRADATGFRLRQTNLAVAFRPGAAPPQTYSKALLVPFAEYLPAPSVPWPKALVGKTFDVVAGDGPTVFALADGTPFAPLICWENLFSGFVSAARAKGAQLLVQLTNDNWFGATGAPVQHDLASVVRAVETGAPIVVASNTGPSLVADARGRVLARAPKLFADGVVSASVAPAGAPTPFVAGGRHVALLAAGVGLAAVLDGARRRRHSSP